MQKDAAGVRGYPRITGRLRFVCVIYRGVQKGKAALHFFSSLKIGGSEGVDTRRYNNSGGYNPSYTWIPAFAGMTEQVQQDAAGVRGVPESPYSLPP